MKKNTNQSTLIVGALLAVLAVGWFATRDSQPSVGVKTLAVAKNMRGVRKQHMVHNHYLPKMEIDAQTYSVRADGQLLTCEPAVSLPMAQRYFLF